MKYTFSNLVPRALVSVNQRFRSRNEIAHLAYSSPPLNFVRTSLLERYERNSAVGTSMVFWLIRWRAVRWLVGNFGPFNSFGPLTMNECTLANYAIARHCIGPQKHYMSPGLVYGKEGPIGPSVFFIQNMFALHYTLRHILQFQNCFLLLPL